MNNMAAYVLLLGAILLFICSVLDLKEKQILDDFDETGETN